MEKSKNIFITGCSRGLGRAMTEGFIARGDLVAGCARSVAAIGEFSSTYGDPHIFKAVDIVDEDSVAAFCREAIERHGPPDLVLNNAATINASARLWEVPAGEFSDVIDVNIKGVVHVIRHILPPMIGRGSGVIVNFSSGWGRSASPEVAPYCATKWAIEGLTAALAQELPAGLAAVALNPGIIDTEMLRSCFGEGAGSYPGPAAWAEKAIPFLANLSPADNGMALTAP